MNDARAITADYANLKFINSRKVLQVICEVPSEMAEEVLAKLGNPTGEGIPVAIAVLEIQPDVKKDLAENAEKAKRKFEDLPYSQQAALLCKKPSFQNHTSTFSEEKAIAWLKDILHIRSRSELDDPTRQSARSEFERIRESYYAEIGSYPEQRG